VSIIDCTPIFTARRYLVELNRQPKVAVPEPAYEPLYLLDVPAAELVPLLATFGYEANYHCGAWTIRRKPDGAA
jgi:hypothetical protein